MNEYPAVADALLMQLPKIPDVRGNLTYVQGGMHIPFAIKRIYWIYDVPGGEVRGGHAYRELQEIVIALSGSFDVQLSDGSKRRTISLNRSYTGIHIPGMIWRQLGNFSTNAVGLVLASAPYDESDYIRRFDEFKRLRSTP